MSENKVSLAYDGGWKELNSIAHACWAIVYLLVVNGILLGLILLTILAKM